MGRHRVYSKIRTIELLNFGKWCLEKGSLIHIERTPVKISFELLYDKI